MYAQHGYHFQYNHNPPILCQDTIHLQIYSLFLYLLEKNLEIYDDNTFFILLLLSINN